MARPSKYLAELRERAVRGLLAAGHGTVDADVAEVGCLGKTPEGELSSRSRASETLPPDGRAP